MQKKQPQFKIYPSLLDAYQWYASSEKEEAEDEFINKINRVPFSSKEADRGTWVNKIIDLALDGEKEFDIKCLDGAYNEIATYLKGSIIQGYTSTQIEIDGKIIELYGYYDYLQYDKVIDLKTTKSYDLGKYKNSMQLHFYPVSLIDNGFEINEFEFLVYDFKDVYIEPYKVDYNYSKSMLIESVRNLINFIESRKHLITDKKIFGIDKPNLLFTPIDDGTLIDGIKM